MNSNTVIRKQHYTSTTVLVIVGVLGFTGLCIYLYNSYKEFKEKLKTKSKDAKFLECPDYWDTLGNGKCQNTKFLGGCSNKPGENIMDFGGEIFTNKNAGDYAKCKWASYCNVAWGGIDRLC
jgi:hypothetical protein